MRHKLFDAGFVGAVALLVAGVLLGSGLTENVLSTPDPLTWLPNLRGEITRVNPDTGTAVDRLPGVAEPGDPMTVVQDGNILVITNLRTFEVTAIDVALLQTGGTRRGGQGTVRVLLTRGEVYLANLRSGMIERIDALSAETIGQPWRSRQPLADATADQRGRVWALDQAGRLTGLRWSPGAATLAPEEDEEISGAGAEAALVPHDEGVTVFTASGVVEQVGTGHDRALQVGELTPPLLAAAASPASLVSVSTPETAQVHLLAGGEAVTVETDDLECDEPGQTAVFHDRVYVPCLGAGRVLVLNERGERAAPDLVTVPGGRPQLLVHAGLLFVNEPGAPRGLVVRPDGSVQTIQTHGADVPILHQTGRATATPTRPPASGAGLPTGGSTATPTRPNGSSGPSGSTSVTPTSTSTSTPSPTRGIDPADYTATGVQAVERGGLSAQVSWTAPRVPPDRYRILRADTLAELGTAPAGATSQIVGGLPAGVPVSFVVEAVVGSAAYRSAPSNAISAFGSPGGPSLSLQLVARAPASVTVRVTVDAPDNGGRVIQRYDVSVRSESSGRTDSRAGVPYGQTFDAVLPCDTLGDVCLSGGTVSATVTLYNEAGAGPPGTASASVGPPPPFNVFENQFVMFVSMGGKCLDRAPFLTLQDCDGSAEQLWVPRDLGDLLSAVDRSCLQHESSSIGLSSPSNGNCRDRDDPVRWVHYPQNDPVANPRHYRGEGTSRCIAVLGDVRASGTQVNLAGCAFNDQDRWFMFRQTGLPTALAAVAPASVAAADPAGGTDDVALGIPEVAVLVLLPVVAGLFHQRRRRLRLGRTVR